MFCKLFGWISFTLLVVFITLLVVDYFTLSIAFLAPITRWVDSTFVTAEFCHTATDNGPETQINLRGYSQDHLVNGHPSKSTDGKIRDYVIKDIVESRRSYLGVGKDGYRPGKCQFQAAVAKLTESYCETGKATTPLLAPGSVDEWVLTNDAACTTNALCKSYTVKYGGKEFTVKFASFADNAKPTKVKPTSGAPLVECSAAAKTQV